MTRQGLVFVWLDDDEMPRIFAETVIRAARGDLDASLILGKNYEEACSCIEQVLNLLLTHGEEKLVVSLPGPCALSRTATKGGVRRR